LTVGKGDQAKDKSKKPAEKPKKKKTIGGLKDLKDNDKSTARNNISS